jgi:hypothetical protein
MTPYGTADEGSAASVAAEATASATRGAGGSEPASYADLLAAVAELTGLVKSTGQQAAGSSSRAPLGGAPNLFQHEAAQAGISQDSLRKLIAAAGKAPVGASTNGAPGSGARAAPKTPGASPKRHARGTAVVLPVGEDGEEDEEEEDEEVFPPTPPATLTEALLAQNAQLLTALTQRKESDPLTSLLASGGGGDEAGDVRVSGVRGCAARHVWKQMTTNSGPMIRASIRTRLAENMEVEESQLQPAALRGFFERRVPFGGQKGLTYFAYLIARMWELLETKQTEQLANLIALSAVFIEQAAIDGGRFQVAWMLTGLQPPAFQLTQRNTQRLGDEPFASLADPRWMAANLSYLKDLDYFEARQKAAVGGRQEPALDADGNVVKKPRKPKAKPSAKPAAKKE